MLSFQDFFIACAGHWKTERTYHFVLKNEIERSYTEFRAQTLDSTEKKQILLGSTGSTTSAAANFSTIKIDSERVLQAPLATPGFAISFDTRSEKGETLSMSLQALFIPDEYVSSSGADHPPPAGGSYPPMQALPIAAQVSEADRDIIRGYYLRDKGYSELGAIAGRFTYQPTRQTLEMTTYYNRSVAVDQMRFVAPNLRLRTIVTYQRPTDGSLPTVIDLLGFGVEHKQAG